MIELEDMLKRAVELEARLRLEPRNSLAVQFTMDDPIYSADLDGDGEKIRMNHVIAAEVVRRDAPAREHHRWIGGGANAMAAVYDLVARLEDGIRGRIETDQKTLADAGGAA